LASVFLRPYKEHDFKVLFEIRNDPVIQTLLITHHKPNTTSEVLEWILVKSNSIDGVFLIIANSDDNALGFVQAKEIDRISLTCYAGIALHPQNQKKGIFPEAFGLFEQYLKETFDIRKVIVEILEENIPSLKSFQRIGYTQAGILSEHYYHDGIVSDVIIMEKLLK